MIMSEGSEVREIYSGRVARIVRAIYVVGPEDIYIFYEIAGVPSERRRVLHADEIESTGR